MTPGQQPEEHAERRVGHDVAEVGMQGEGGGQPPPLAGGDRANMQPPGGAPIPTERRRSRPSHDQPHATEVADHAPPAAVDARRWRRAEHGLVLTGVFGQLGLAGRRVLGRDKQQPPALPPIHPAVDASRRQHQLESAHIAPGRACADGDPTIDLRHARMVTHRLIAAVVGPGKAARPMVRASGNAGGSPEMRAKAASPPPCAEPSCRSCRETARLSHAKVVQSLYGRVVSNTEMSLSGRPPVRIELGSCQLRQGDRCASRGSGQAIENMVCSARRERRGPSFGGVLAPLRGRVSKAGCRLR